MSAPTPGPTVRTKDQLALATWDLGGQGPPLLLLHPTGFHGRCWAPLANELLGDFRCWALDQRGHGASDRARDYSWRLFSDDVIATIGTLGLERPFVAGHSLGGGVALMTEALAPGTFRGIFGFEPIVMTPDLQADRAPSDGPAANNNIMADLARRRRPGFVSRAAALENYARKPPFALFRADALWAYVEGGFTDTAEGVTLSCDTESEALVFEAAAQAGVGELLRPSATPTFLVCGGEDPVIGPAQLEDIAGRLHDPGKSRVLVEIFAELGHLGPYEDPKRVGRAIKRAFTEP